MIYIISANTTQAQLLKFALESAFDIPVDCQAHLPLKSLVTQDIDTPYFYLLDCLESDLNTIEKALDITPSSLPGNIKLVLYNCDTSDRIASLVKKYKIRGVFGRNDSQSVFIRGMTLISEGNLWLSRKTLADCIFMTADITSKPESKLMDSLSPREREILKHVVFGESNQEIADSLNISLHTVKTHLYNAYRKIDVPNRLQATLWAAANLRHNL